MQIDRETYISYVHDFDALSERMQVRLMTPRETLIESLAVSKGDIDRFLVMIVEGSEGCFVEHALPFDTATRKVQNLDHSSVTTYYSFDSVEAQATFLSQYMMQAMLRLDIIA